MVEGKLTQRPPVEAWEAAKKARYAMHSSIALIAAGDRLAAEIRKIKKFEALVQKTEGNGKEWLSARLPVWPRA